MLDWGIAVTDEVCVKLNIPPPTKDAGEVKFKLRHIDELISLSDGQVCSWVSSTQRKSSACACVHAGVRAWEVGG